MENERKRAFKELIMDTVRSSGKGAVLSKDELVAAARADEPALFDDSEPCYPGCKQAHPKWRHEFDRSIYDLTNTIPALLRPGPTRGTYRLG